MPLNNQKGAGVFTTVSTLVEELSDNPAARMTAQEILERVGRAEQARPVTVTAPTPSAPLPTCPAGNCVATAPAT